MHKSSLVLTTSNLFVIDSCYILQYFVTSKPEDKNPDIKVVLGTPEELSALGIDPNELRISPDLSHPSIPQQKGYKSLAVTGPDIIGDQERVRNIRLFVPEWRRHIRLRIEVVDVPGFRDRFCFSGVTDDDYLGYGRYDMSNNRGDLILEPEDLRQGTVSHVMWVLNTLGEEYMDAMVTVNRTGRSARILSSAHDTDRMIYFQRDLTRALLASTVWDSTGPEIVGKTVRDIETRRLGEGMGMVN